MEQQPPLSAHEAGMPQPGQGRRFQSPRHHLLLWLLPVAMVGGGSVGWTRQTVYARDLRTGYVRRAAILRPVQAGDPHAPPDDDEPPPVAAVRHRAGPPTTADPPLHVAA